MRFDRIGKVLLEAYCKVGPEPSWGKAAMILCTGEKERIFADNVPVIVLSGAFKREFRDLLLRTASEKKKAGPEFERKQRNQHSTI